MIVLCNVDDLFLILRKPSYDRRSTSRIIFFTKSGGKGELRDRFGTSYID